MTDILKTDIHDTKVLRWKDMGDGTHALVISIGDSDITVTLDGEAVVLGAGTATIGKLGANSGIDIGDVDVITTPATAAEGAALPSVFLVVAGDDGADTHPLQVDGSGYLKAILQTGSAAIGKLAANSGVDIGDVDILSIAAGETHVGEIGSSGKQVDVTPTITGGAYAADDVVGGIQTIASASRVAGKAIILQSLVITDLAKQDAAMRIFFFNANPGTGTYSDNGALTIHDTDMALCIGAISIAASDYIDASASSVGTLPHVGLELIPTATSLFAVAQTKDADTWTTTADLTFKYLFDRN